MKGNDISRIAQGEGMTNKPIITCAGDWNLFCSLEAPLVAALPQDSSEWRRSYGRVAKSVYIEATFIKFDKETLPTDKNWNLLERPIFHIFWTDCVDIESYKTTLRDSIDTWLKILQQKDVNDWMIVLVETYDIRKSNKLLPRTTVLDKIRNDFASKHDDRCLSVINPVKSESRSAESWRGLVSRIRHFVLTAYNRTLIKFEEYMREQREKRNDPNWNFADYFILQEQLAFVLEMLGLYDESLVQYDELDALFTQFVLNSNVTKSPLWLTNFQRSVEAWHAIKLGPNAPLKLREQIIKNSASLLDFRSYLFQRQATMLLFAFRPWEIADRCLSTIHNTVKELAILEINIPQGAASCWSLLACLETLRACDRLTSSSTAPSSNSAQQAVEMCTMHQAPLWHYAKDKLYELGKLCGLLPGSSSPNSEQLHMVVMLSAGMGDSEVTPSGGQLAPTDRLKEALCSKQAFQTHYLELAELAMGTYKHIGRLRFARFIGRDLAAFYSDLGEMGKAVVFLSDALRSYEEQSWKDLAAQTRLELVACFLKMGDNERYAKLSATIASTVELEILVRNFYFDEMIKTIKKNLNVCESIILCELSDCFKIMSVAIITPKRGIHTKDNPVEVCFEFESLLPREIACTRLAISVEEVNDHGDGRKAERKSTEKVSQKTDSGAQVSPSRKTTNVVSNTSESSAFEYANSCNSDDLKPKNPILNPLNIVSQLHYKEDRTLDAVSVQCNIPKMSIRRSDSHKYRKVSATVRNDYTNCVSASNLSIKPGHNEIVLNMKATKSGLFKLGQVSLILEEKLEFLSNALVPCKVCFEVTTQNVSVALNKVNPKRDLMGGLEHSMELVVTNGSVCIENDVVINLKTSSGLIIQSDNGEMDVREVDIKIPACGAFETVRVPLRLLAYLYPKKDDKPIEHKVWLQCPWFESVVVVPLHFSPPFNPSWRLLTSNDRKFLQVTIAAAMPDQVTFVISEPKLACDAKVTFIDMNPRRKKYELSQSTTVSFMWQLETDPLEKPSSIKAMFSMLYKPADEDILEREYKCPYDFHDYLTLFVVHSKLEPTKGSDFCRASQMSYLQLSVQKVNESDQSSLMYEVLADQSMWAVCGRTAGVITVENGESQLVTLEVMPLVAGYLPLPTVRLSKYIAANQSLGKDSSKKPEIGITSNQHPRLEPFSPGQVYHKGKSLQVHVLPNVILNSDSH